MAEDKKDNGRIVIKAKLRGTDQPLSTDEPVKKSLDETLTEMGNIQATLKFSIGIIDDSECYQSIFGKSDMPNYVRLVVDDVEFGGPLFKNEYEEMGTKKDVGFYKWYIKVTNSEQKSAPQLKKEVYIEKVEMGKLEKEERDALLFAPKDKQAIALFNMKKIRAVERNYKGSGAAKYMRKMFEEVLSYLDDIREAQSYQKDFSITKQDWDEVFKEPEAIEELKPEEEPLIEKISPLLDAIIRNLRYGAEEPQNLQITEGTGAELESSGQRELHNYRELFRHPKVFEHINRELDYICSELEEPGKTDYVLKRVQQAYDFLIEKIPEQSDLIRAMITYRAFRILAWCERVGTPFSRPVGPRVLECREQIIKKYNFDPDDRELMFGENTSLGRFGSTVTDVNTIETVLPWLAKKYNWTLEPVKVGQSIQIDDITALLPEPIFVPKYVKPDVEPVYTKKQLIIERELKERITVSKVEPVVELNRVEQRPQNEITLSRPSVNNRPVNKHYLPDQMVVLSASKPRYKLKLAAGLAGLALVAGLAYHGLVGSRISQLERLNRELKAATSKCVEMRIAGQDLAEQRVYVQGLIDRSSNVLSSIEKYGLADKTLIAMTNYNIESAKQLCMNEF